MSDGTCSHCRAEGPVSPFGGVLDGQPGYATPRMYCARCRRLLSGWLRRNRSSELAVQRGIKLEASSPGPKEPGGMPKDLVRGFV